MNKGKLLYWFIFILIGGICFGAAITSDPFDGTGWNTAAPNEEALRGQGYLELQDLRKGVAVRANKEHVTYASSSAGGNHLNGSAVCYEGTTAEVNIPDDSAALSNIARDRGRLWLDSNYDPPILKRWSGSGWVVTGVRTAQIADANVTTSKIADANVTTGKLAGYAVTTSKIADSNVTLGKINFFIDEDDMASDSAVKVPSQQSVKAYVDSSIVSPLTHDGSTAVTVNGAATADLDTGSGTRCFCYVKVVSGAGSAPTYSFAYDKGGTAPSATASAANVCYLGQAAGKVYYIVAESSSAGVLSVGSAAGSTGDVTFTLMCYIK